jgi:protein-S-isoprenylcysteine O-methyltransferase Ste14
MTTHNSLRSSGWLALRSLLWTILIPGVVGGYVPWRFLGLRRVRLDPLDPVQGISLVLVAGGAVLLGMCIVDFARYGRGTLAPADAPRQLVVRGLYRYVRNPMYLSVTTILVGELLLARSAGLLIYLAVWLVAVNLFVIGYEEPTLRRRFGAAYERYARRVHRWLPRLPRRPAPGSSSQGRPPAA